MALVSSSTLYCEHIKKNLNSQQVEVDKLTSSSFLRTASLSRCLPASLSTTWAKYYCLPHIIEELCVSLQKLSKLDLFGGMRRFCLLPHGMWSLFHVVLLYLSYHQLLPPSCCLFLPLVGMYCLHFLKVLQVMYWMNISTVINTIHLRLFYHPPG